MGQLSILCHLSESIKSHVVVVSGMRLLDEVVVVVVSVVVVLKR
jgi:hypothetical protein